MQILARIMSPPPPTPCITLPARSILILMLRAAMSDPMKKIVLATRRIGLRPQISLNLPHVGTEADAAKRYAEPIQE